MFFPSKTEYPNQFAQWDPVMKGNGSTEEKNNINKKLKKKSHPLQTTPITQRHTEKE